MDTGNAGSLGTSSKQPPRTQFQSIEDFVKEHDELDLLKASQEKQKPQPQPKKKPKKEVDGETLATEAIAVEEIGDVNWVGRLLEYRNVHPPVEGITYVDGAINSAGIPRFTCTVVIIESSHQFGGNMISFSNKKNAKQFAAKKAINWLIENGYMPGDGSVKFPKAPQPPPSARTPPATSHTDPPSSTTYAAQVPDLCYRLGFNVPKYEIHPVMENTSLYDAYADFGGDPRVVGKVGETKNVFGKKRAKEEVARVVISFLKDIERQRLEQHEDDDRKRKRALEAPGMDDAPGKTAKVQG